MTATKPSKPRHTTKSLAISAAIPALVLAALALMQFWARPKGLSSVDEATAWPHENNAFFQAKVVWDQGHFTPNLIHAPAGRDLRLAVLVPPDHAKAGCPGPLEFPTLARKVELVPGGMVVVELAGAGRGRVPFTCGTGEPKGYISYE